MALKQLFTWGKKNTVTQNRGGIPFCPTTSHGGSASKHLHLDLVIDEADTYWNDGVGGFPAVRDRSSCLSRYSQRMVSHVSQNYHILNLRHVYWTFPYSDLLSIAAFLVQFSLGVPRGVLLKILGGSVPPVSPNRDPVSDQKNVIFHTCF